MEYLNGIIEIDYMGAKWSSNCRGRVILSDKKKKRNWENIFR